MNLLKKWSKMTKNWLLPIVKRCRGKKFPNWDPVAMRALRLWQRLEKLEKKAKETKCQAVKT
jgi:hypothetical protein